MSWYEQQVKANVKVESIFDVTSGKMLIPSVSGSAGMAGMSNGEIALGSVSGSPAMLFKSGDQVYRLTGTAVT